MKLVNRALCKENPHCFALQSWYEYLKTTQEFRLLIFLKASTSVLAFTHSRCKTLGKYAVTVLWGPTLLLCLLQSDYPFWGYNAVLWVSPRTWGELKKSIIAWITIRIIIQSKFFFLFIGREPTTWPANNCLQIMVCSCAMPSNCVWLQIIFCTCVKETVFFSFLRSLLRENGRSLRLPRIFIKKNKLGDRMIKQLLRNNDK